MYTHDEAYCDVAAIQSAIRGLRYGDSRSLADLIRDLEEAAEDLNEIVSKISGFSHE